MELHKLNKETKIACAQEMTNHSAGCAGNGAGAGEPGDGHGKSQGTGGSPEARIHNRCIFGWGQDVSQKKNNVALDCFINNS